MMDAPEWKNMSDWSDLPDVYVAKAECQQGMFWRIEACSVPMAIGPEVRLIRADRVQALVKAAVEAERALLVERLFADVTYAEIDAARAAVTLHHSSAPFNDQPLYLAELVKHILTERRALASPSGVAALAALRAERDRANGVWQANLRLIAERDDLCARLAEAEGQVKALTEAVDGAVLAMKAARGVIVSKHEHGLLTGALVKCAEAKAGVALPAALSPAGEAAT